MGPVGDPLVSGSRGAPDSGFLSIQIALALSVWAGEFSKFGASPGGRGEVGASGGLFNRILACRPALPGAEDFQGCASLQGLLRNNFDVEGRGALATLVARVYLATATESRYCCKKYLKMLARLACLTKAVEKAFTLLTNHIFFKLAWTGWP